MGICFILVIFGLSVSAIEEDLQGYPSMKNEITTFRTTKSNEELHAASTELPAQPTIPVICSTGTDLFHTQHERINAATNTDAITPRDSRLVLTHSTDLLFLSRDNIAKKRLQADRDFVLISNDEGVAETEFRLMMNDTLTPSAHLSSGREEISAFLHAPLKSKNQTVLDSITFSPTNGIPVISASDPAVIDNLGESNESMESQGKNKNENWTLELFRSEFLRKADQSNKTHSAIMHFTVPGLLTAPSAPHLKNAQYPKRSFEGQLKEQKNINSQSLVMLNTPSQVKPTNRVLVNGMTKSRNPTSNEPKPIWGVSVNGPDELHPDSMFLFSTSKVKTADSTTLNDFPNIVTAAGQMHVTKQFASSWLISDSLPEIVPARGTPECKLISKGDSSKKHHIKQISFFQTLTTSFIHRLNKSDVQPHDVLLSTFQSALSSDGRLLQTPALCSKTSIEAGTCNVSEIPNVTDNSSGLLSKLIAFTTVSDEEASMTGDERILMKHPSRSFTAPPTLSALADTSKPKQFEKLSTGYVFSISKENTYSPTRRSATHLLSEIVKLFASDPSDLRLSQATREPSESMRTQSSFAPGNVRSFRNNRNFNIQKKDDGVARKVDSVISKKLNVSTIFTGRETVSSTITSVTSHFTVVPLIPPNSNVSRTSITFARTAVTSITPLSLEPQVSVPDRLLSSHAVSRRETSMNRKSQNIKTTDHKVPSKLGIRSYSNNIFSNRTSTTENISSLSGKRQQGPKNLKGSAILFSTVSTTPSVRQQVKHGSRETSLTATPRLQSKVEIESYLKKTHSIVKATTVQHINQSDASQKSTLHKIPINSTSLSTVVYSTVEFKNPLTYFTLPGISSFAEQVTQPSVPRFNIKAITPVVSSGKDKRKDFFSHQASANSTDVHEHPQNVKSGQISGFVELLNRHERNTSAASMNTPSPHQTGFDNNVSSLSEKHTRSFYTLQPSYRVSTAENRKIRAQSADIADVGSPETQTFTKSKDVNPYVERDSIKGSTEFVLVINRRKKIILPDSLSGLAQISDDICSTGNYTAEMSLNLESDIMPGDLVPALGNLRVVIILKTNNSHVDLEIKSCCLSPAVRLDEFNTTCCIFSRRPADPPGTRLHPSVPSKMATFTIRLFQMINYSSAYLHCDPSVCLRNHSDCERQCVERRNARPMDVEGAVFRSAQNRISFGPVLKWINNSSLTEAADTEAAMVIMSAVAGCLLACLALLLVWMAHRRCLERSACCWSEALCEC